MLLLTKRNLGGFFAIIFLSNIAFLVVPGLAQLRKMKVGDKMPEFSMPILDVPSSPNEPNNIIFSYKHNRERVLGLVFLSANQKQSQRAVTDIEKIVKELDEKNVLFDFVGVTNEETIKETGKTHTEESKVIFPILLDEEYELWGKLGIIARPTVLVVGKDDRILWIKAGYGFDFAPSLRVRLNQALGLTEEKADEGLTEVRTLTHDSTQAKVKRHLRIASRLEQKGRLESAIAEIYKARQLDPNSIEVALAIGVFFCRTGQSKKALDVIEKIKPTKRIDKAQVLLISGWAKRQIGELETAEKLLVEAVELNPKSGRGYYELGKIYQANGETKKAMEAYRKALAAIFGER